MKEHWRPQAIKERSQCRDGLPLLESLSRGEKSSLVFPSNEPSEL